MKVKEAKAVTIGAASDAQLREVIGLQTTKLGINGNEISEANKVFMMRWLRQYYGWLNLYQFSTAFNMAINGQLEADSATYGKFTVQYIGGVLSAYKRHCIGSGEVASIFDAQRRPLNYEVDRSKITDMKDAVRQWEKELKEKAKLKLNNQLNQQQ